MSPLVWMLAASAATLPAAIALADGDALAVTAGYLAPLAAAIGTWKVVERTAGIDPMHVMPAMLRAMFAKVVFFIAYVVIAVKGLGVRPEPFILSFAAYYIALHAVEAVMFQRLFRRAGRGRA